MAVRVAFMPDGESALPDSTSEAPTMSVRKADCGDCIFGFRIRSTACAMSRPVTTTPVLYRTPFLMWNVYVRPPSETCGKPAASSGTSRYPAGGRLSGYRTSDAQIGPRNASAVEDASAGSRWSKHALAAVLQRATRNVPPLRVEPADTAPFSKAMAATVSKAAIPLRITLTAYTFAPQKGRGR
jgi:hypothetical protein